jgi:hypothetical protein
MTQPTPTSPDTWNAVTHRIFHAVGAQIHETRKIHYGLRFWIAGIAVTITFLVYTIALLTA